VNNFFRDIFLNEGGDVHGTVHTQEMQDSEDANGKKEGKSSEDTIGRDRVKRGEEVKGSGGKAKGSEKARSVEAIDGSNMVEIRAYSKLLLTWLEPHLRLRERKHTRVKRALQRAQLKELLRDRAIHPYVSSQFFYDRLSLTTKQASFVHTRGKPSCDGPLRHVYHNSDTAQLVLKTKTSGHQPTYIAEGYVTRAIIYPDKTTETWHIVKKDVGGLVTTTKSLESSIRELCGDLEILADICPPWAEEVVIVTLFSVA
jgi:hypothetical protein